LAGASPRPGRPSMTECPFRRPPAPAEEVQQDLRLPARRLPRECRRLGQNPPQSGDCNNRTKDCNIRASDSGGQSRP
jgi:hypothetical protein